jgi:hypothetical protein
MNPAMLAMIVGLVEEAIKLAPHIRADLQTIFSHPNPTPEDWAALRAKVLATSFESLAPDAKTVVT